MRASLEVDQSYPRSAPLRPLRVRAFRRVWSASMISFAGTWMQLVTVPYVIDQITHSSAWVGVSAFCMLVPIMFVAPFAGSWSDRCSRYDVVLWSQAIQLAAAAGLWVLWSTGSASRGAILAVVIFAAVGNGIQNASMASFVPELVPPQNLVAAVRLTISLQAAARAVGPALAGLVLGAWGPSAAFGLNALSFVPLMVAVAVSPRHPGTGKAGNVWSEFRDGVRHLRERHALWTAALLMTALGLFGLCVLQLAEPVARHVLHVGPEAYGLLVGAFGVGGVVASIATITLGDRFSRASVAAGALAGSIGAVALLGAAPDLTVGIAAMGLLGVGGTCAMMAIVTSAQANTTNAYRGRTIALLNVAFNGGVPIGGLVGGILGELIGLRERSSVTRARGR